MLLKNLIEFGLTEKEAQAYISLLKLEIATAQEVAKDTGIKRSTAYVTLETLKEKGLVGISDDAKVQRYIATSPDIILKIARENAALQERILKNIEETIPEMKALHKETKKRPVVKVFTGKQGVISGFEDTLTSKEKLMRVYSDPANLSPLIGNYLQEYIAKRLQNGIRMKSIHPYKEIYMKWMKQIPKEANAAIDDKTFVDPDKYPFPADMAIYDNRIGYQSTVAGGISVLIESEEMAGIMKAVFDLAFEEAKRINLLKEKNSKKK